ncbi:hypothetical protein H2200_011700 [Cladophialophora chaetospira]|uniref:Uncharacterized protein n=1 Tax=Cladophialophora chaetospira TaxID=386627 RepID=A0AA39CCR6_9EURO|nr:hypothetical protein H2200_011700 [Cladophialophora chaetospira]
MGPETTRPLSQSHRGTPPLRLPDELLIKIVGLFVTESGICISNDPDYDVHLLTIRSLLQTCYMFRREVLARVFENPIHIYITSGHRCRCKTLKQRKNLLKAPLGKALRLPLVKWGEVIIHFVPNVNQNAGKQCLVELPKRLKTPPKDTDVEALEMQSAVDCIARQSFALCMMLRNGRHVKHHQKDIKFSFKFEGTGGVDERNTLRERPLWTPKSLFLPLRGWKWTQPPDEPVTQFPRYPPIHVPSEIAIAVSDFERRRWDPATRTLEESQARDFIGSLRTWWNSRQDYVWYGAEGPNDPEPPRQRWMGPYTPLVIQLSSPMPMWES